jgi:hypothetical protein
MNQRKLQVRRGMYGSLSTTAACREEAQRGYQLGYSCSMPWCDEEILRQLRGFRQEARLCPIGFQRSALLGASLWAGYYAGKKARQE